jgi:PPM family protein phosphatase
MPYKVMAFGLSDIGLVRHNNEDVWAELPGSGFYALADGMGGHQAGEVAAREAVFSICKLVKKVIVPQKNTQSLTALRESLHEAIIQVNAIVYKKGRSESELKGMGTTLCCLLFHEKGLVYAYVGDSRIYRMRNNKLTQLTKDHSLLRELMDLGQLNENQASDFIYKNIITKAIGTEPTVDPSVHITDLLIGDIYMMCTDGLSDLLSLDEIEAIINMKPDPQLSVEELVKSAKDRGGHDNVTTVVMKVENVSKTKDILR